MAFTVASKGAPLAGLLKKLLLAAPSSSSGAAPAAALALRPVFLPAAARRLFNTGGAPFRRGYDDDDYGEESSSDEDVFSDLRCRRCAPDFSDPTFFSADVLPLMEDDDAAAPRREWWVSKEDDDAVELKVAMPGLGKEHVKVWADKDGLMIKGEGTEDDDNEDYRSYIELPSDAFKMDQIKAEMKDGLLKLTVPKIKVEDRKDVFQVKVE